MPLDAPVTRAVPFDGELLISFFSCLQLSRFVFHMAYGYNPFSEFDSYSRALVTNFFGGPMRHSKAEKAKTHKRIVAIASRRFREEGLAGIGIADLMKEAGLTVGGFYKHFNSRDALVAEAVGSALELWKRQADAAVSGGPPVTYESLVDEYLSEAHRNHPGTGCPIGALAGDLARSDKRTRALVSRKIQDNIELLATLIRNTNKTDRGSARSQAILTYCALVGAIGMARAISDEELSREILKTAAQRLKNPAS
jgi:TetR/AcrR family transcriptional repressor of nem operon